MKDKKNTGESINYQNNPYNENHNNYDYSEMRDKNNQNFSSQRNFYEEIKFSKYQKPDDSFIVEFGFKHYFTFFFIFVTLVSFVVYIRKNPPRGGAFMYNNSVYYPKYDDPLIREALRNNKIDPQMVQDFYKNTR